MPLSLEERQEALNKYNFMDKGRELFGSDAERLTYAEGCQLDYLVSLVLHRDGLRKTLKNLEKVKDKYETNHKRRCCSL